MKIPFTQDQFFEVFKDYNLSVWPLQVIFFVLAVITVILAFTNFKWSGKTINLALAFFWLWIGIVYHWVFFSTINKAAFAFGAIFVVQGLLFLYFGVFKSTLVYHPRAGFYSVAGLLLITYALIAYPAIGYFLGHRFPESPTFGLPCPTTIFTFGMMLLLSERLPPYLLSIPVIWALIGFNAAISFGVLEDIGLPIAAAVAIILVILKNRTLKKSTPAIQRTF